ncbi:hypothetical protein FACS189493_6120 [Spirochaetia bacterium]|nr:hypothetical protein FACS189493_6120 [Spirochaetia bacterium]
MTNVLNNKNVISKLSVGIISLIILWSIYPFFLWSHRGIIYFFLSSVFIFLRFVLWGKKIKFDMSLAFTIFFGFFLYEYVRLREGTGLTGIVSFCFQVITFILVLLMRDEEKCSIIKTSTTIFAWICGLSLIIYILVVLLHVQLPYSIIEYDKTRGNNYPPFKNYMFLLVPQEEFVIWIRFQSVFLEPSFIGNYGAVFLYINHYDLKRKNVFIIFLAMLFSLSLAGYVLLILGYGIHLLSDGKHFYRKLGIMITMFVIILGIGYYVYEKFPDSILSTLIIGRLQLDNDKGISGNNRQNSSFNYQYNLFKKTDDYLFGLGSRFTTEIIRGRKAISASYQTFIFINGLIGISFLFLFYVSIFICEKNKLLFGLLLLKIIGFLQYPYGMWEIELFIFICAGSFFKMQNNKTDLKMAI